MTVTVQRVHGITPSQRIQELQLRLERYNEELETVKTDRDALKARLDEIERQNPLIEAVFTASGRIIQWNWYSVDEGSDAIDLVALKYGKTVTRLYAEAPVQTQPHEDENAQKAVAE